MSLFLIGTSYGIHAQPTNDVCANAITLLVDGSCNVFDNTNATPSNNPQPTMHCDQNFDDAQDIWFRIVAPASGNLPQNQFYFLRL